MPRPGLAVPIAVAFLLPTAAFAKVTPAEIQSLLDAHNAERCHVAPPAAAMPALTWNAKLAKVAQKYADACVFEHNAARDEQYAATGGSGRVGENIAMGTYSIGHLVGLWADEKSKWKYTGRQSHKTGHYNQMIWAGTTSVGCGVSRCGKSLYLVCDYAPAGNYVGRPPYTKGSGTNAACAATGTSSR